jgi:hypothetical protein
VVSPALKLITPYGSSGTMRDSITATVPCRVRKSSARRRRSGISEP